MKFWNQRKKRIQQLEAEVEDLKEEIGYLAEDIQLQKYCILGSASRLSDVEQIIMAISWVDYKNKEEEVLLN